MDYKEKLRLAKEALESGSYDKDTIEYIFPELKESNDDNNKRISKEISRFLKQNNGWNNEWLTWLKKQGEQKSFDYENANIKQKDFAPKAEPKFNVGDKVYALRDRFECTIESIDESTYYGDTTNFDIKDQDNRKLIEQKPTDKVKPKFHEGEWVIDKIGIVHQISNVIENVTNHTYGYDIVGGGYFNDSTEGIRLWTISDAKNGDVLVDEDNNIGIYKEIEGVYWDSYIYLGCDGELRGFSIGGSHKQTDTHPATKEQRDTLMTAMAGAGYTFDFDKKELKKVEK